MPGVVMPGNEVRATKAFVSTTDPARQLWAADTGGVLAHDSMTSAATYSHR